MLYLLCWEEPKKHPNKTPDMDDAILVFEKWMLDYQKTRS